MKRFFALISVLILLISCSEPEQRLEKKNGTIPTIDSLITRVLHQSHIPGAVIQVKQGDSILHRAAYGYAFRYNEEGQAVDHPEPMTADHLFDLASLTKVAATTYGLMLLVDKGKVRLDDPIHRYLQEFKKGKKSNITIRNLLSHSAGLYQWKPTYYFAGNRKEQYQYIASLPLKWPAGEGRHYSDLGFMLLGEIIKRVSGQPLDKFLRERLYRPLDLRHTAFNPKEKGFTQIAVTSHGNPFERHMVYDDDFGYRVEVDPQSWNGWRSYTLQGEVSDGNAWYAAGGIAGHAGLFSNIDDLQVLIDLLLNKGKFQGHQLLSSSVIDTFLTKNRFGNGLGWAMDKDFISAQGTPPGTFGHTGFTGTNIVVIPKYNLSIIFLTNREHAGLQPSGYYYDLDPLRQQIVDAALESKRAKATGKE